MKNARVGERGDKLVTRWHSHRLGREVTLARWGSFGRPVLLFPTAGGDAEEIERFWMIRVLAPLLDAGQIKLYSCDSIAGQVLLSREGSPQHQMWIQDQFHQYVRHEVAPAIRLDCQSTDIEIWTAGASIGAFHAAAMVCRFPDVFSRALAMSGTFDLRRFYESQHFTDHFWQSSPMHFLPLLSEHHLQQLRKCFLYITSGEGKAEDIRESWNLAKVLGRYAVPNFVDSWGPKWDHDWVTWREMLPQVLTRWLAS